MDGSLYLEPKLGPRLASLLQAAEFLHTLVGALGSPLNVVLPEQIAENPARFRGVYRLAGERAGRPAEGGWALELDRPLDAAVSTTALHRLPADVLRRACEQLAALLRPGGVLVNSDQLSPDGGTPSHIGAHVGRRRAERQRLHDHEDWRSWWAAAAEDPELADLPIEHPLPRSPHHNRDNGLPLTDHVELPRQAGFEHISPVWQFGTGHVLVAVR